VIPGGRRFYLRTALVVRPRWLAIKRRHVTTQVLVGRWDGCHRRNLEQNDASDVTKVHFSAMSVLGNCSRHAPRCRRRTECDLPDAQLGLISRGPMMTLTTQSGIVGRGAMGGVQQSHIA